MNLALDLSVARGYKSRSQIARRLTEDWATRNLFCPSCPSDHLEPLDANTAVSDYLCPRCNLRYQLKSKGSRFGRSVSNSAYQKKIEAIERGTVPHYVFLRYSPSTWRVADLFILPGYFITSAIVLRRPPLSPAARRAGWVGSNILLGSAPPDARIHIVTDGTAHNADEVRAEWERYRFLEHDAAGGWGGDILACLNELRPADGLQEFSLQEFYERSTDKLRLLHSDNHNVHAKIRQQLQVLRDGGVLQFLGHGHYRLLRR